MTKSRIAIVIPAHNEAATIASVVSGVGKLADVIVVDDKSTDDTARVAADAGADVVRHQRNLGYDGALNSGFARAAEAGFDCAITIDADGQHPAARIGEFIERLESGCDMVLGVRDRLPRISERLFAYASRLAFGVKDPCCGMKGYRLRYYRSLGHFDSYGSVGTELMFHAIASGARYVQMPIDTAERADQPRFGRAISANWRVLRAAVLGFAKFGFRRRAGDPAGSHELD